MAEALSLSLRAWPTEDPNSESLPRLIPRINEQRSAFRNVTELGLEEEIRVLEASEVQAEDREVEATGAAAEDSKSKKEEIVAAREDLLKQVAQAQMETLYALDFVSLLLSKETPRQAEISMSQHLRQSVPIGSLGVGIIRQPQPSGTEKRDAKLVSQGWKLQGLTSAADSLLRSATRLEIEMEQETRYWEQVLAVKEQGWSICRLPRDRHTLGVRYGFAEAAPEFGDRGLAALRRDADGNMALDQGITASHPKAVRVRIKEKDMIVGTSSLPNIAADADIPIEDLILRARNNIFEEELFHEINREARTLASQGVCSIDNIIHLPTLDDRQILVDVVRLDYKPPQPGIITGGDDELAELIALSLRILLSNAHRRNLLRRSQLPPPLTERKPPRTTYAILRPILTYLQHQSALTSLSSFLGTMMQALSAAGLQSNLFSVTLSSLDLSIVGEANANSSKPTVEALIEILTRPLESSTTVTLPASSKLQIKTRTHLYPPMVGTEYNVTTTASPSGLDVSVPSNIHFNSKSDLLDYILHLLTLDIVTAISNFPATSAVDSAESNGEPWLATDPHSGELTKSFGNLGRSKRMLVGVSQTKLEAKWGWMNGKPEEGRYAWDGDGDGEGLKTLEEVVDEAGRYEVRK